MFIGGANPKDAVELRAPSIKGLLRFWWRTLMYSEINGDTKKLKSEESAIFGGSDKGEGQACFLIEVKECQNLSFGNRGDERWNKSPVAYLGFGPIIRDKDIKKSITVRPYLKGGSFTIQLRFKPLPLNSDKKSRQDYEKKILSVKKALWAMAMFGGLGSRSRKGFGSIVTECVEGMEELPPMIVKNKNELINSISSYLKEISIFSIYDEYPKYTAWSDESRCIILEADRSGIDVLEWLGQKILSFRSYRCGKKFPWVVDDHNIVYNYLRNGTAPDLLITPKRAAFGLPHNYFFSSLNKNKQAEINYIDHGKKGRRASPLFFKIQKMSGNQKACVIVTFLPAVLIPPQKKVVLSSTLES
jgi:CRISPR-associated protein Cmr1